LEPLEFFQRDPGRLDTDVTQAEFRHDFADGLVSVLVVPADVRLEAGALVFDLCPIPVVTDQNAAGWCDEAEAAFPSEAGQIGDIACFGEKQAIERRFPDGPGEVLTAAVVWDHAVRIGEWGEDQIIARGPPRPSRISTEAFSRQALTWGCGASKAGTPHCVVRPGACRE